MKLIEILTQEQINSLLMGNVVGFFEGLFSEDSPLNPYANAIEVEYFIYHSATKKVSPFYERLTNYKTDSINPDTIVCNALKSRFLPRWEKIFNALLLDYSPLDDYSKTEVKTGINKDIITYNTTKSKTGNDTDTTTYNITNAEDEKLTKQEDISRDTSNSSDMYGFNSSTPVGDTLETNTETESTTNTDTKNNTYKKTGTESKEYGVNENETNTGSDTKDYTINESTSINGRNTSGSELLQKEIEFRVLRDIYPIIFKDIDSLMCLDIYERS